MSLIKKPSELTFVEQVRALIYGQPGIGKSTLALSAPSPLLLDFDRGVHRVNPQHLRDTVVISKWEDVDSVLNENLSEYQTLIVDTAGKMIEFMTDFLIRQDPRLRQGDGSLSLKGYGARKVMFKNFFSRVSMLKKNLVFVAHEIEERDGDTKIVRPEIGGSSGNDLMKELDLVGYMEAIGKRRTISFDATEKFYGKNTCNLPERIEVKDTSAQANILLTDIFLKFNQMLLDKVAMRGKYQSIMNHIDTIVENAETLQKINAATTELKNLEHIWDSKIQSAQKLNMKAKAKNFVFDRQQGVYVQGAPRPEPVQDAVNAVREFANSVGRAASAIQEVNEVIEQQSSTDANGDTVTITTERRTPTGARRPTGRRSQHNTPSPQQVPPVGEHPEQQDDLEF